MDAGGTDLLLFVAGEPDSGVDPFRDVQSLFVRLFVGSGQMFGLRRSSAAESNAGSPPISTAAPPMRLPPDQARCVEEVVKIAGQEGRRVVVVDVNQSSGHQDLVARWVGANDVFPVLVRPDGARLEGAEEFLPRKIRRFFRERAQH